MREMQSHRCVGLKEMNWEKPATWFPPVKNHVVLLVILALACYNKRIDDPFSQCNEEGSTHTYANFYVTLVEYRWPRNAELIVRNIRNKDEPPLLLQKTKTYTKRHAR